MATLNATEGWRGPAIMKRASGWYIAAAIAFIVLGIFSIAEPGLAGLAMTLFVGWLLIFGGATHLLSMFGGGGVGRVIWQLIVGIFYIFGGFYFLTHPLLGLGSLTLLLAAILAGEALFELVAYFGNRREQGSGWMLLNGVVTLLLSGLIWRHWPSSSVWAIGTLVGVNLLMTGLSRLMLGLGARRLASRLAG
jgi:uncharacterized membrane protein HdeD (DUF308 family)